MCCVDIGTHFIILFYFRYIGSTPLIIASFFDQPGAIAILLAAGADRGARTEQGQTALDVAPSEACRRLLE